MSRFQEFSAGTPDPFHPHSRRRRALFGVLAVVLCLGLLGAAFFRTQILQSGEFRLRADDNRFDVVPLEAPRGTIFDRDGKVIAETVTGYSLSVLPGPPDSVRARLAPLVPLLALDSGVVAEAVRNAGGTDGRPVLVVPTLSFAQVSRLEERRGRLPSGVLLETRPIRRYPAGAAVAHVVGYVLEIDDRELARPEWEDYRSGQHIGKTGVERQYERVL